MTVKALAQGLLAVPDAMKYRMKGSSKGRRTVQIMLDDFWFGRYFYAFTRFFDIAGYDVVLDASMKAVYALGRAQYGNRVLEEKIAGFGVHPAPELVLGTSGPGKRLVPSDLIRSGIPGTFDVPMAQHPMMYSRGYWNQEVGREARKSALFIGNCSDPVYDRLSREKLFDVIDRPQLLEILGRTDRARRIDGFTSLREAGEGTVCIADSVTCRIPMESFRPTVATFRFFICAPGAFMPLCHNLVEILSAGVIPILQRSYAGMMPDGLVHGVNAFIFEGVHDLESCVESAFSKSDCELDEMRRQVDGYYQSRLTPAAVVAGVLDRSTTVVRMLAAQRSLDLLRARLGRDDGTPAMPMISVHPF